MIDSRPIIESLGDHDYLVRFMQDDDGIEIQMRATPAIVARIAGADADEARVIAVTAAYLIERQSADELPGQLDLDDVLAAYDGCVEDLRDRLSAPQ